MTTDELYIAISEGLQIFLFKEPFRISIVDSSVTNLVLQVGSISLATTIIWSRCLANVTLWVRHL